MTQLLEVQGKMVVTHWLSPAIEEHFENKGEFLTLKLAVP